MLGLTTDHLTFFHKHKFIEVEELMTEDEIDYTESKALYVYEPRDPNCHALKKLGYGFNDRIRSETHPILYQR